MPQFVFRCLTTACSAFAATAFAQQAPTPASSPKPVTQDATPASIYRSAWSGYRPFADEKVISWKEANDEVLRIGGWRAYLRESQGQSSGNASAGSTAPAAKDAAKPTPSDAGAVQGHDAHNKPKESR